jgi:drug/metabolite transporter (DMT)-like permease
MLFALGTFFLWGTTNFLIGYGEKKLGMDAQVFTAIMWVSMGALGVAMLAYLWLTGSKIELEMKLLLPVAAGLFLGVGILSFVYAMSHEGGTGATAAIATCNAVFTVSLAFIFLKEPLEPRQLAGIAAVIVGIVLLRV